MARRTAGRDSRVIKCGPGKRCRGLVTALTGGAGGNMRRRFAHDPGIGAAMTGRAAGHDPLVVHRRPWPKRRRRSMARLAPQRRGNVPHRFAHDTGGCAAMTGRAARCDPRVIIPATTGEEPRGPHLMTTIAR